MAKANVTNGMVKMIGILLMFGGFVASAVFAHTNATQRIAANTEAIKRLQTEVGRLRTIELIVTEIAVHHEIDLSSLKE